MLTHGIVDVLKLYLQKEDNKTRWFLIDQGIHLLSILVLYILWFYPDTLQIPISTHMTFFTLLTAIIFLSFVSSVGIQIIMTNWSKAIPENENASLNKAGKYIGILERLLAFIFILSGHWAPVGFLLAAKSVLRFGDLKESKDRKLTEYILIGTLLSFGIAVVTGIVVTQFI